MSVRCILACCGCGSGDDQHNQSVLSVTNTTNTAMVMKMLTELICENEKTAGRSKPVIFHVLQLGFALGYFTVRLCLSK